MEARAELATRLQLPPGAAPQVAGDLTEKAATSYTLEALLSAVEAQPRLRALSAREVSASARLKLEQASRYPDSAERSRRPA